jgi:hypothetical protein
MTPLRNHPYAREDEEAKPQWYTLANPSVSMSAQFRTAMS